MAATLADTEPDTQTHGFADTNTDCGTDRIAETNGHNFAQTAQGGHAESDSHQRSDACVNTVAHGSAIGVSDTVAKPDRDNCKAVVSHVSDNVRDRGSLPDCIADDLGNAHPICCANVDRVGFGAVTKCGSDLARFADGVANRRT
jgi:hypothetical protein